MKRKPVGKAKKKTTGVKAITQKTPVVKKKIIKTIKKKRKAVYIKGKTSSARFDERLKNKRTRMKEK